MRVAQLVQILACRRSTLCTLRDWRITDVPQPCAHGLGAYCARFAHNGPAHGRHGRAPHVAHMCAACRASGAPLHEWHRRGHSERDPVEVVKEAQVASVTLSGSSMWRMYTRMHPSSLSRPRGGPRYSRWDENAAGRLREGGGGPPGAFLCCAALPAACPGRSSCLRGRTPKQQGAPAASVRAP